MNLFTPFLPENKWHLLISASAVLLTLCSLLAISISLHTAYMWLIVVFMTVLFLTSVTFSNRPQMENAAINNENFTDEISTIRHSQPYWIVDVPPTYTQATGLPTGTTPPPSYNKVPFLPPIYERKADIPSVFRYGRHESIQSDHFPEVFLPPVYSLRHGSISSVQTLYFNILENN